MLFRSHLWHHPTGYRYFIDDLARDIADSGHNIVGTIFVECKSMYRAEGPEQMRSVGETEFAAGQGAIADSHKYTKSRIAAGIVANADPTMGSALAAVLDAHLDAGNGRLRGIRQRAKWDADPAVKGAVSADAPGLYLQPAFQEGLREVAKRGLIFEASIYHPQLPDVVALARAIPELEIVLVHSGSPVGHSSYRGREHEVHATWLDGIRELATCPNARIKLGGLLMTLANFDFGTAMRPPTSAELAELWRPFIEPCFEVFGPDRCMVSSNFPVDKRGFGYGTVWNMFKRLLSGCSDAERTTILSGTASAVYRV